MKGANKTWFIDIDGTIFKHNGYLEGEDVLLDGVKEFLDSIPEHDYVILTTARNSKLNKITMDAIEKYGIRNDGVLFGLPTGERILINDCKPDGTKTAYCKNLVRDAGLKLDDWFKKFIKL